VSASPASFVANALQRHDEVARATAVDSSRVAVDRKKYGSCIIGCISSRLVKDEEVSSLAVDGEVDFIANIPKEAMWNGSAIELVEQHGVGWGTIKDLFSALGTEEVRGFVAKEYRFIERIFREHSSVRSFDRVSDRVYSLKRRGKADVVVALVNEYDVTADHVRTAWDRHGPFTDILANNPNCRWSDEADDAAEALGVNLLTLSDFMGRLNRK
jgi:hypothetical protein